MFQKRERPSAARLRDDAGEGDGSTGSVPVPAKRLKSIATASSSAGGGESGLIGASTKRGDADAAAVRADKYGDAALSGFKANDSASNTPASDAVRRLEVDTEVGKDTRAILERNQDIHKGLKAGTLEAGVYRGLGGYKQYAERGEGAIANSKYSGQLGPTRGISNVRSTLRIEYIGTTGEGGICKDYKEAGYCGFGDSCKFLHDRSDYKPSYILEKEWDEKQKAIEEKKRKRWEKRLQRRQAADGAAGAGEQDSPSGEGSSSEEGSRAEELPSMCPKCQRRWEECSSIPIQTVCGHHFCEDCALANFARSPKCITCDAPTNGIFNSCDAIEEKIKQRKLAAAARKKARGGRTRLTYDIGLED